MLVKPTSGVVTRRQAGFNLVEVLISVVILGIMAGIGMPNFSIWLKNLRLQEAASTIQTSLVRARTEAQRINARVSLCRTGDVFAIDPDCDANVTGTTIPVADEDWSYGWLIYTTTASGIDYDPSLGHELIAAVEAPAAERGVSIAANADAASFITYGNDGRIESGSPTFAICDDRDVGNIGYRLLFAATGRPMTLEFSALDAVDRVCDL